MADRAFLAEQYRRHGERVFRRCLAMGGGDREWAADVTQDVYLRLHERRASIRRTESIESWLLTVADRLCLNRLRRERSVWQRVKRVLTANRSLSTDDEPTAHTPPAVLERLRRSLVALPEKERAALTMKYVEGERQTQIATRLACSEGYVSKLLARGIARLRAMGWEAEDG